MGSEDGKKPKAPVGAVAKLQSAARAARTGLAVHLLDSGLYAGQDQVMMVLAADPDGLTLGQIAARLNVRPPTVTKTVTRLQAQGFVERRGSETDLRQTYVHLTEAGLATIRRIEKSVRRTEKVALKGLKKKEIRALMKMLDRIEANLSPRPDAEPAPAAVLDTEVANEPENA